jgi:hypothetical protein
MEYRSSVVRGREVKLVVVLAGLEDRGAEVDREVVFGRVVVGVVLDVLVALES